MSDKKLLKDESFKESKGSKSNKFKNILKSKGDGFNYKVWILIIVVFFLFIGFIFMMSGFNNDVDTTDNITVNSNSTPLESTPTYQIYPFNYTDYYIEGEGVSEVYAEGYDDNGDRGLAYKIELPNGDWYIIGILEAYLYTSDEELNMPYWDNYDEYMEHPYGKNVQGHPSFSKISGEYVIITSLYNASSDKYLTESFLRSIIHEN